MPDLHINRVPSLPVTDDGSARPLTEDLSTASGDGEDIAWDADTAEAGEVPAAEFTEDDVAFLSAPQEADAAVAANGTVTEGAPGPYAAPAIGESGRWFRPAKAKKKYLPTPPEGPVLAPLPEGPVLAPDGRRLSRRRMLQAGMIGGVGVAALPLLALVGGITRTGKQAAGLAFSMNTNWLFGGRYTSGSETSSYDDSNFAPVTVPHTVVPLSWKDWNYLAWQQVWIYRRHFSGDGLLDPDGPGNRILVDFDGVMVNATVSVNDHVVATHQGGYLPFSAELTGKVTGADNLLSVVVDSRCLPVPPVGAGRGPGSVDFFQPGGIYRDVRLRVLPQVFLADLFVRPADVLGSRPRVDIECTLDSAAAKHSEGTLLVQLFDGQRQIAAQTMAVTAGSPGTSTARLSLTGSGRSACGRRTTPGCTRSGPPSISPASAATRCPGGSGSARRPSAPTASS
jgi:hypothetical protein